MTTDHKTACQAEEASRALTLCSSLRGVFDTLGPLQGCDGKAGSLRGRSLLLYAAVRVQPEVQAEHCSHLRLQIYPAHQEAAGYAALTGKAHTQNDS